MLCSLFPVYLHTLGGMTPEAVTTVLASAAMGALVSSAFTLIGTTLERKSRRKELLLTQAFRLTELHTQQVVDLHKTTGKPVRFAPLLVQVRWFHKELKRLHSKDVLSPELEERFKTFIELGKLGDKAE